MNSSRTSLPRAFGVVVASAILAQAMYGEADAASEPAGTTRRDFNAVPEPSALVALLVALSGCGLIRQRLS